MPLLPSKFLLNVRSEIPFELGDCPIPIHGPQALSNILAPASIIIASAPLFASILRTCFEPGAIASETSGCTVFPFNICATFIISRSDEFVQEPIQT